MKALLKQRSYMKNHLYFLEKTLKIANESVKNGNHPFGALIVQDNKIICESGNEVETRNDITAHAELLCIQKFQTYQSKNYATLFTSCEPCAMCLGAIYWSNINEIIFGCSNSQLSKIVDGTLEIKSEDLLLNGKRKIKIHDYSNMKKFKEIHINFWK